jgi:hypothetical protein
MDTGYQINIRFFYPQKCSAFLGQKIALQFLRPENLMTIMQAIILRVLGNCPAISGNLKITFSSL